MKLRTNHLLGFYRDLPIRRKMVLVLYFQILIPLILIGFFSYRNSEDILKRKATDYSRDILKMIELRLNDCVNNVTIISQDLLYDNRIYDLPENDESSQDPLSKYEYENNVNSLFKKIVLSRPEIQSICFVSSGGGFYFADNNSKSTSIRNLLPYDKMLEKARDTRGSPIWYIDSKDGKAQNVYLARIVYDRDSFREIGMLAILVKSEFLDTVYQGLTGNLRNIVILSEANHLIASRNSDPGYVRNINQEPKFAGKKGEWEDYKNGMFVSHITMENTGWKIVAYVELKELYNDANVLRRNIIVLCVICIMILSFLSMVIAVDFVQPINRLVKAMRRVQKGETDVCIAEDREDELGFMAKTFNEMSGEIHHLVNWVYREQLTRKEAEIKALQSQINPHFLFNTLESINWMAQLNNVPEISEMVSDLSALMEASIGRDNRLISLNEEFSYADRYISLLKKRFEDRIELVKEVNEEVLDVKIPKLLIQPLIENAVHHGIEKSRNKGIINLKAYTIGENVVIEVNDNGIGMDTEEIGRINENLRMNNDEYFKSLNEERSRSIGIENVNRRIKLFYGENYGLIIESEEGSYTRVVVTIPNRSINV